MALRPGNYGKVLLALGAIALAAIAAYHNSFSVPLLFDDRVTIKANPSIQSLWSLRSVFSPPNEAFSAGRPFLNLTFAINYAMGGVSVRGYHIVNLLVHSLAGMALFGIVRLTLSQTKFKERYGRAATILALAAAVLWTVHPVQTESVTYISQRAESLMGLLYFSTLYFFIRAALSPVAGPWAALSIAACALGMMTKEVMASAPLIVLLYDRAFIAGSFLKAWRQRWRIYLGLAATWPLLAYLMASSSLSHRGVGYSAGFSWWKYALTESKVVTDYLKLALWPHPLVFDYGPDLRVNSLAEAAPYLLGLALILALTLIAFRRCPGLGFLGAWFFIILAPSSSIVPIIGEPMAESRLYLPLAALVVFAVIGLYESAGKKGLLIVCSALAIVLGTLSASRNSDYGSELEIWNDTVAKRPENVRAHNNLGNALADSPGRLPDAIAQYEIALTINPHDAGTHYNLGSALTKTPGRESDAIPHYEAALAIKPDYEEAHYDLAFALAKIPGQLPEAIAHYEAALRINPQDAVAHDDLGIALAKIPGRLPDAIAQYEAALRIHSDFAEAHNNLGLAIANVPGRLPEAIAHYEAAVKINPAFTAAHYNLAYALANTPGRSADAIAELEVVLKIDPDDAEAHYNLGVALLNTGRRTQEAWNHLQAAVRLNPDMEPIVARLRDGPNGALQR